MTAELPSSPLLNISPFQQLDECEKLSNHGSEKSFTCDRRGARPSAPWPLLPPSCCGAEGRRRGQSSGSGFDYCLQGIAGPPTGCSFHHVDFSLGERSHQSSYQLQNAINQSSRILYPSSWRGNPSNPVCQPPYGEQLFPWFC
jgi:hypothetical protein